MPPYPKKQPRKKPARGAVSRRQVENVRTPVYDRDGGLCVAAGALAVFAWPCSGGNTIQHGAGKGMGGSAAFDGPEYLRTMCSWHNTLAEINADFARICEWFGWSVSRGRVDAGTIDVLALPVRYPDGGDYLLDSDCGRTPIDAAEALSRRRALFGDDPTKKAA